MKKFFALVIRQSVAIVLAIIFIAAFGIFSTLNMPINLLPDINVPMVCVQVIYPGANALTVEEDVTAKLEEGLSSLSGVNAVNSYSYANLSAVVLSFDYGTDTGAKQNEINGKISSIDLPDDVTIDVYDIDLNAEALAVLSVTSSETGLKGAYSAAEELAARLSAIDGVENVEIKGGAKKIWNIRPFDGLELTAPLFVKAFSYNELDIPLGDLTDLVGNVQIKNNSKIKSEEDIRNTPISLPASIAAILSGIRRITDYYADSTAEELRNLADDLDGGVLTVLSDLDEMSVEEMERLAELKTYMNLAGITASDLDRVLNSRMYSEIYDSTFKVDGEGNSVPKDDEELKELAGEINDSAYANYLPFEVTVDLLKVIQDNKLDDVKAFREELEESDAYKQTEGYYELTDEDYLELARLMEIFPEDKTDGEILADIDFVKQTSAAGLAAIADKKRNDPDYELTNGDCTLLFAGTTLSQEHPVIMSQTFMAFVRSDSYERNMTTLIEKREKFGDVIDADEYFELYEALDLTDVLELRLSRELIAFIVDPDRDFSALSDSGELVVSVEDIATVSEDEEYSSYVYFGDGAMPHIIEGTTIEIYKSNGANSSAVVRQIKSVYARYLESAPEGIKIELLDDQSQFISESIINVLVSLIIGGVLAVIVIFLFLKKVKTSLIISVTMPLSVLASLICLSLMGVTLNMVSLGGLAVGIGMLVDNSIVVIESISKHRDSDKSAFDAAVDGTAEVGGALFGSTLTTVCVFIPIIFSGGLTAEIFTDLSFAVIFSLTFSLIVAVTIIPALYAMLCNDKRALKGGRVANAPVEPTAEKAETQSENIETQSEIQSAQVESKPKKGKLSTLREPRIMDGITSLYGKILPKVLKRKVIPIVTAIAIFAASIGLLFLTGIEFLPSIDKGQVEINMTYESGTSLQDIMEDVKSFSDKVEYEFKDSLDYISASVGKHGMLALTDTGLITLQLKTNRGTDKAVDRIRALAEKDTSANPARSVSVKQIDGVVASLMSGADDLSVTVLGNDNDALVRISSQIITELEKEGFKDVKSSATDKAWQSDIVFDKSALAYYGIDYQTLVVTLRIGIASYTACTATIGGEQCSVNVSFAQQSLSDVQSLRDFTVGFDSSGNAIKLSDVAEISQPYQVDACIRRSDGKKMVSVSATLPGVDTGTAGKKMQSVAQSVLDRPENAGYTFNKSGISSYLDDAFEGLAVALVISFFLLYAVMAIQFGSAVKPLIIMASIPFSFTGGFIALVITGTSLNVVSFIGLIMLMGVVVNNAIVMLEKIKQLHDDGMEHFGAVQKACKVRLRPILMTTLTTILALIPLAIGVGQGSELMQPLGIVVIGGLLISTLVTLVLVPVVYCAVHRLSESYPNGKSREKAAKSSSQKG